MLPHPTITVSAECIEGQNRVLVTPSPEGGIQPYKFEWSGPNATIYNDEILSSVIPGDYMVTVIDALGCMFSDTVSIATCCDLNIACALVDTIVVCPSELPEVPSAIKSATNNDEITAALSAIGITVQPGSCGELAVDVIDLETNSPDCSQNDLFLSREYTISDAHNSYSCTQQIIVKKTTCQLNLSQLLRMLLFIVAATLMRNLKPG